MDNIYYISLHYSYVSNKYDFRLLIHDKFNIIWLYKIYFFKMNNYY